MMHQTDTMANSTKIAALAIDGSQPAWMTLNEAREHAFTGEIVFETDPEVHVYLDNGIVYYAERVTDVALGRRLLDAGLLDMIQLERGTVRVGDIEHLGRLFDRDPSVDRDSVIVLAETTTQELIIDLANRAITTVRATAYRHHPSGVHRWFVAPVDPAAVTRPVSVVAQLDTTVVGQLPGLPFGSGYGELTIEWDDLTDEPDDDVTTDDVDMSPADELGTHDASAEAAELDLEMFEQSLGLAEFTDDVIEPDPASTDVIDNVDVVEGSTIEVVLDVSDVTDEAEAVEVVMIEMVEETADREFTVVWPDGFEEPESTDEEHQPYVVDLAPAFTRTVNGDIQFVMPPLTLGDEPELADANVPDDVVEAVRSAIAAIESASFAIPAANAETTPRTDITAQLPEIVDIAIVDPFDDKVIEPAGPVDAAPVAFGGFSPPTLATSATALYGQLTTDSASAGVPTFAATSPAGGAVEAQTDHPGDRSSALRRLIGSLRRKDH